MAESWLVKTLRRLIMSLGRRREATVEDLLASTQESARKLAGFARGLRSFSINISQLEPERISLVGLRQLVGDTLFLLQLGTDPERDLVAEVTLSPDLPPQIHLPIGAIQLILFVLLENAKNAMKDGTIRIRISRSGGNLVLEVQDEGGGMPKPVQDNLYKPFFTTKDRSRHTGLGLFMVKRVVERLQGTIEYESEANKGTTFRISVPH